MWHPVLPGSLPEIEYHETFLSHKERSAVKGYLRAYDRKTHEKGRQGGAVGAMAMLVFEALAFHFTDQATGICRASYDEIAGYLGRSRSAVIAAANHLRDGLGVVKRWHLWNRDQGQAANGWSITPPSEVFYRLFGGEGVHRDDTSTRKNLDSKPYRPRRNGRVREVVLGEVQPEPVAPPGDAQWEALTAQAAQAALEGSEAGSARGAQVIGHRVAEEGNQLVDNPGLLGSQAEPRAERGEVSAHDGKETLLPIREPGITTGEVQEIIQPADTIRPEDFRDRAGVAAAILRAGDFLGLNAVQLHRLNVVVKFLTLHDSQSPPRKWGEA